MFIVELTQIRFDTMVEETRYRPLNADADDSEKEPIPSSDNSDASEKESIRSSWWTIIPDSFSVYTWPFYLGVLNLIIFLVWLLIHFDVFTQQKGGDPQLAVLENGIYSGRYDSSLDQFHFLGMPYALPPVGHLRFRIPQPFDHSWHGIHNATEFGPMCIGYRGKSSWFPHSEDCLTINVMKPANVTRHDLLPVAAFVHGGGIHGGGSRDDRYNMKMLVSHATKHNMPFIAVSFNYRSSIWGFISNEQMVGTRSANLGLRDQRLALHWVQKNIAAFGGDPRKVTLMGASSGADDVGLHLTAYGGRDDGLFRAAILQSGSSVVPFSFKGTSAQEAYERLVMSTGCSDDEDPFECLRHLPFEELNNIFDKDNSSEVTLDMAVHSIPAFDGDFIRSYGTFSLPRFRFTRVPIIIGVTSNEGYDEIIPGLTSWGDLEHYLISGAFRKYPRAMVARLLSFYPKDTKTEPLIPPILGIRDLDTYRRITQVLGDLSYNAARRLQCGAFSKISTCYSYIHDDFESLRSGNPHEGARHGAELAPVLQNSNGLGYSLSKNIFEDRTSAYFEMSKTMGLMWAGFITQLDPNAAFYGEPWPRYNVDAPRNIVFNETGPFWTEEDTERRNATDYILSISQSVLGK
ncbi:cholinesterase [Nemania diffusa]|nr:cholinesterase [Nemania diffusa]